MLLYIPKKIERPKNLLDVPSAWKGLENIIADIIERFGIGTDRALEFGVEYGFSTTALSNYFSRVVGVDTFEGDENTLDKNIPDLYELVAPLMPANVTLVKGRYQDYRDSEHYDLIHVDIVHTYRDTFDCGDWAMKHSRLVLFHDTRSFPAVLDAVSDLAIKYGAEFHNYPFFNGLGILWQKPPS